MLNRIIPAAVLLGAAALVSPAIAQNIGDDADDVIIASNDVEPIVVTTNADSAERSPRNVSERVATAEDGTVVVTRRETRTRTVRVSRSGGRGPNGVSVVSGGIGGSIGGRDIIGTTPADNALLPPWASTP